MKPKVFKVRGWGHWWMWFCRVGECWKGGKSRHWELALLDAVEHHKTHAKKYIPHDNDMTPPNGIHRYQERNADGSDR